MFLFKDVDFGGLIILAFPIISQWADPHFRVSMMRSRAIVQSNVAKYFPVLIFFIVITMSIKYLMKTTIPAPFLLLSKIKHRKQPFD